MMGSGKYKAECLNKCFSNIGQELSKTFQDSIVDTNQNFYRITPSCSQIKLSEEQLVQKLKRVKQKSGGTQITYHLRNWPKQERLSLKVYLVFLKIVLRIVYIRRYGKLEW